MALEQLFEEQISDTTTFDEHRVVPSEKWRTADDKLNLSGGFECNICLDLVRDPVVTFCGHLYCWPCIYKWIHFQTKSSENSDQQTPQCPVCKAEVSLKTLIPLYGRGQAAKTSECNVPDRGILIPQRPPSPTCGGHTPTTTTHSNSSYRNYSHQPAYMTEPILGSGGVVYSRMFGNSLNTLYEYPSSYTLAGSSNPRLRRQLLLADRSLNRICFFFFCCAVICLLLF